ncbi:MAG: hypothetical protein C0631_07965 [Sedimenticola sp.]|nr:MAG: hypothetical protein C0631_07965 [Sedimenticola sp.]
MSVMVYAEDAGLVPGHNPFMRPGVLPQKTVDEHVGAVRTSVAPKFRLRAVMLAGAQGMVLIDENLIAIGEEVDGYRLLSVSERMAVFQGEDKQYQISLDQGATDNNDVF